MYSKLGLKSLLISSLLASLAIAPSFANDVFVPGALFGKVSNHNYGIQMQKSPENIQDYQSDYGRPATNQMQNVPGIYNSDGSGSLTLEQLMNIKRLQANKKEQKRQKHKKQYLHRKSFGNFQRIEESEI